MVHFLPKQMFYDIKESQHQKKFTTLSANQRQYFLFDNFKHYTPLFKALSIDPVYNNNTAQLAFL